MADAKFFTNYGPFNLKELADFVGARLVAPSVGADGRDSYPQIVDVCSLERVVPDSISFLTNPKYLKDLQETIVLACIIDEKHVSRAPDHIWLVVSENAHKAYAQIAAKFYPFNEQERREISPHAIISETAVIGKGVLIGPHAIIEDRVIIGDGSIIGAGTVIKKGVVIGQDCEVRENCVISHTVMGDGVLVLQGCSIGHDGFGFANDRGVYHKVPQLGLVLIGNNVEIGVLCAIDRGSSMDTVIGDMCRIGNMTQIAHNVTLGRGCILAGQVGIAGSTHIGDYCVIGGQAGVAGHLRIGQKVQVAGKAGIVRDVADNESVGGFPAVPIRDWHRQAAVLNKIIKDRNCVGS